MIFYKTNDGILYNGHVLDILKKLPSESVNTCITSPPYWNMREYGSNPVIWGGDNNCNHKFYEYSKINGLIGKNVKKENTLSKFCRKCNAWKGQLGLEPFPELYVKNITDIFNEVKRILKPDGTLWLNIGDTYIKKIPERNEWNLKVKDLAGIPWAVALSLRNSDWYLRQDIIWAKKDPIPEPINDRCTRSHEYIFLLSKSKNYYYDNNSIKEASRRKEVKNYYSKDFIGGKKYNTNENNFKSTGFKNKRDVWFVEHGSFTGAHCAPFSTKLIEPCILAGCPENGVVLDPFFGSGTTGYLCELLNRKWIGIDTNENYCEIAKNRISKCSKPKKAFRLFF